MEPLTKLEAQVLLAALEQLREDLSQSTLKPGVEDAMNSAEAKLEKYVHDSE